jgi:hypothetical protein
LRDACRNRKFETHFLSPGERENGSQFFRTIERWGCCEVFKETENIETHFLSLGERTEVRAAIKHHLPHLQFKV